MSDDLQSVHAEVQAGMEYEDALLKESSPVLWWADNYHQNSRGEPMDFTDTPFLVWLYQALKTDERMVVEKSVQCGLSELFIIASHVEASAGLTVMYVLPKYELRNRFVNNRIFKLHTRVPHYRDMLKQEGGGRGIHRTSMMHFGKGTLSYVGSNVESEFIEMPIDSAYVDEVDRCNLANLEMLPDRYTASPYKFHREISNPTIEGFGIDARYQKSTQGQWFITCEHCGKKFVPDFFTHVVREIGPKKYAPRDPNADPDPLSKEHMSIICECGKPTDRLMEGEYVHAHPNREWQGYRISKLFNKLTPIRGLYNKWIDAQGNDTKIQVFYNSDLGLPFSSKGAKITEGDLNACKRDYIDVKKTDQMGMIFCGVDVGAVLHYVVREMVEDRGVKCLRQIDVGTVPTFELLIAEVLDKWKPKMTVIDAMPEIHKVQELKDARRRVFSSMFQMDQRKILVNKKDAEIKMDRTAILDYVKKFVDDQNLLLPANAEFLMDGEYYSHMKSSTRILEANDDKPEKSRFVWAHTAADHFFLAEAYCVQAWMLVPHRDMFEFFKEQSASITQTPELDKITGLDEEEKLRLERLARMNPEQFISKIGKGYTKK